MAKLFKTVFSNIVYKQLSSSTLPTLPASPSMLSTQASAQWIAAFAPRPTGSRYWSARSEKRSDFLIYKTQLLLYTIIPSRLRSHESHGLRTDRNIAKKEDCSER
ncbi:hypothetical protein LPB260_15235 [Pseudomonas sp. LPB0260]|uniref:hypothetical protein n=1 Tax=Pseudomonas sp. LPB0260 TaxID=2614442 RepID=UPI0015C2843C|nr:hypothetical protein [Pseudomonas sp. LPB0260]QLC72144.1 hypothetical protein LPB260_00285 [Pseudomonas sp. LPB0260]QLC74922.1 hypothetical protein LPB260_15235 [Pseudomonas sp. LPB0260]